VGIITGAQTEKGWIFCAGADLKQMSVDPGGMTTKKGGFAGFVQRERTKPVIAAVDGPALAGGTEIVLACDLVVASETAVFGIPEVKRNLVAGWPAASSASPARSPATSPWSWPSPAGSTSRPSGPTTTAS
jgi:enoyl-CoA hydratase